MEVEDTIQSLPLSAMSPAMRGLCADLLYENSCLMKTSTREGVGCDEKALETTAMGLLVKGTSSTLNVEKNLIHIIADYVPEHRLFLTGPGDIRPGDMSKANKKRRIRYCSGYYSVFKCYFEEFAVDDHVALIRRSDSPEFKTCDLYYYKRVDREWILHRDSDKPAIVKADGTLVYMRNDQVHRDLESGPAIILTGDPQAFNQTEYSLRSGPFRSTLFTNGTFATLSFTRLFYQEYEGQTKFYFLENQRKDTPGLGSAYSVYAAHTKRMAEEASLKRRQRVRKALRLHEE